MQRTCVMPKEQSLGVCGQGRSYCAEINLRHWVPDAPSMRGFSHESCGAGLRPSPREFLASYVLADVLVLVWRLHLYSVIAAGSYSLSIVSCYVLWLAQAQIAGKCFTGEDRPLFVDHRLPGCAGVADIPVCIYRRNLRACPLF